MSLKPSLIEAVPSEIIRVARPAFPKGNLYISIRNELGTLFEDTDFTALADEISILTSNGRSPKNLLTISYK